MLRFALYALCLLAVAMDCVRPARAQSSAIEVFDTTFRDWMTENGVERGMIGVAYKGHLVFRRGYGGQEPDQRVLLASLSKAITGRCVAVLVADGRLRLDGKAGDVLSPFFRQYGEPADARLKDVTVEQLLVHRAGFAASPRDLMTPAAMDLLQTRKSPATASPAELLAATLTAPLASAPGEAFRYSNIGYLVLGVMIEVVTGEDYERFCGRNVLEQAGIRTPALDKDWRAFSSFGGWSLSAPEYLAFLARDRLNALIGPDADPAGDPERKARMAPLHDLLRDPGHRHAATGGPAAWPSTAYALGQFIADTGAPAAVRVAWHTGIWGVPPDTVGMLAMQHESGASWFVWYTPRPRKDATDTLIERLAALPETIATWPVLDLFPEHGLAAPPTK